MPLIDDLKASIAEGRALGRTLDLFTEELILRVAATVPDPAPVVAPAPVADPVVPAPAL